MDKLYIREQVNYYKQMLQQDFDPTSFVLNNDAQFYQEQIAFFQEDCDHKDGTHQFALDDRGRCIYCEKNV